MKKLTFLLIAFVLTITSCSKDDSPSEENSSSQSVLVKRMILTSADEDLDSYWNNTINFSYNGTKLVQAISDDNLKNVYFYTGDLITKIEYYNGNTLIYQDLFTYNSNGKLIEYRDLDIADDYEHKHTYTYNSNGTVTSTNYQGSIGNASPTPLTPNVYTFVNGELTSTNNGSITYDSKNNPFKNVTGYQEIINIEFSDDYLIAFGRNQNLVSAPVGTSTTMGSFSTHTYNENNYPVTSVTTANYSGGFSGTVNVQYFYE